MKNLTKRDFIKLAPATVPVAFLPSAISGLIAPAMAQNGVEISFETLHNTTENKTLNVWQIYGEVFRDNVLQDPISINTQEELKTQIQEGSINLNSDSYSDTLLTNFLQPIHEWVIERGGYDRVGARIAYIGIRTRFPVLVIASTAYLIWFNIWDSGSNQ